MKHSILGAVAGVAFAASMSTAHAATAVDLELQLLVDVSGSVNSSEFALQRDGYVNAFRSAAVKAAIQSTADMRLGKIAAQLVYWSSASRQQIAVDWSLLDSDASIDAFADGIANFARPFTGGTAPGSALNFGAPLFASNMFDAARQVIDVSGDGSQNDGASTSAARDAALAAGVDTINGIVIGGSQSVFNFYNNNVKGGANAFVIAAPTFAEFESAISRKLISEITMQPIPLPAPVWMSIAALGALSLVARRRKA